MLVPFAEGGPNRGQDTVADRLEAQPDGHDGGQGPFQSALSTDPEDHGPAATSSPKERGWSLTGGHADEAAFLSAQANNAL